MATRGMGIEIGVGIGPVRFGMTEGEVQAVFPDPEQYEDWMGGNLDRCLLYQGLIFGFERRDRFPIPPTDPG